MNSVLMQHIGTCGCEVQEKEIRIMAIEPNDYKRKIKDALYIISEDNYISSSSIKTEKATQEIYNVGGKKN